MLQTIRHASKGWVSWVIVIAISIPFALWGIERFNADDTGKSIFATFGDYEITYENFYRQLDNQNAQLQEQYGENFERIDQTRVRQQVAEQLFGRAMIFASAYDYDFVVSDPQVKKLITADPSFQIDGNFNKEKYLNFLANNNTNALIFEGKTRKNHVFNQYIQGFFNSNFVTKKDLRTLYQLGNHERRAAYVVLPWEQKTVKIDSVEVTDTYEKNQDRFTVPEKIQVEYVSLSVPDLVKTTTYTEQQLKDYYEDSKADFTTPEEREVRHILFSEDDKDLAENIRLKILAGEDFSELAKEHSIDTFSSEKGGDLGFVGKGIMTEEFENSMFSLQVGEIGDLVETEFGYHIIEVVAIKGGETLSFGEAREKIVESYQLDQANDKFFRLQEELSNLAFDNPDSLLPIKESLNLTIHNTDWFGHEAGISSDTLTQYPAFRHAAFSSEVKEDKLNSSVLDIEGTKAVVLRVKETKEAYVKPLEEVKTLIEDEITKEKASASLLSEVNQEIKKLQKKELTWKNFIKKYDVAGFSNPSLEWLSVKNIDEETPKEVSETYKKIFETKRIREGGSNKTVYSAALTSNKNIGVVYVTGSRDVKIPEEEIVENSETWKIMNDFQRENVNDSILEVLITRYPIPRINLEEVEEARSQTR